VTDDTHFNLIGNVEFTGGVKIKESTYTLDKFKNALDSSNVLEWSDSISYKKNALITYEGYIYVSLTDNNLNQVPNTTIGTYWKLYSVDNSSSDDYSKENMIKIYENHSDMENDQNTLSYAFVINDETTVENNSAAYRRKNNAWEKIQEYESVIQDINYIKRIASQLIEMINSSNANYTAFEIFVTDTEIPAGTPYKNVPEEIKGNVPSVYLTDDDKLESAIPADLSCKISVRDAVAKVDRAKSNVKVDFGDGTIIPIQDELFTNSGDTFAVTHTYAQKGKYLIKIFGDTYFNFRANGKACRCLDEDLPIAKCVTSLLWAFGGCPALFKVEFSDKGKIFEQLSNIANFQYAFNNCQNLLIVSGFGKDKFNSSYKPSWARNLVGMFGACKNLRSCDFKAVQSSSFQEMYNRCSKLTASVKDLLPSRFDMVDNAPINLNDMFDGCISLTTPIPAEILWEDPEAETKFIWTTDEPFKNCSNEIRAQVPISWGGTNVEIQAKLDVGYWNLIQKNVTDELEARIQESENSIDNYYSSFEVYPNDQVIPVGDSVILGGYVSEEIPVNMTERLFVRTFCPREQLDVIIDWGDEATTDLSDLNATGITASTPDSKGEYLMYCEHTYEESKKYVVKIYGRNYFSFGHDETCSNLTCRIFSGDLPIALHLRNLSSVCVKALRLLKVVVNGYDAWIKNVENISGAFYMCYNLLSVTGFRQRTSMMCDQNLFQQCRNLVTTDYKLKTTYSRPGACDGVFGGCVKLAINDISKLLPDTGFIGSINFSKIFFNCSSISGTVPASKLWEDSKVTWINTSNAFTGCSEEIRAQVPISWGGTNQEIEDKLQSGYYNLVQKHTIDSINTKIRVVNDLVDYTAFEVYPNSEVIPVGESEVLGGYVSVEIPANTTEKFYLRENCPKEKSDVIIDWGDGTVVVLADADAEGISLKLVDGVEYQYYCEHTYEESAKYVVKIYGHSYWHIGQDTTITNNNLICRVFESDLPIASHLHNFSGFCMGANRLIKVEINAYDAWIQQVDNINSCFMGCQNLLECTGFRQRTSMMCDQYLFTGCTNLTKTDYRMKSIYSRPGAAGDTFNNCPALAVDISKLLPDIAFFGTINMSNMFKDCASLSGIVPASKLWENSNVTFTNTTNAFKGCSESIRAQVPTSWGGTNTDIQTKLDNGYYNLIKRGDIILNENVTASNWVASNTYPEFPYQCSINIENVTENSDVDVVFGLNEALSGNYAPICLAGNGAVTIYSKVNNAIIINKIRVLK